jgi:hypothetical protein
MTSLVSGISGAIAAFAEWSNANPGLAGSILAVVGGVSPRWWPA